MAGPLRSLARLIGRGAPEQKSISLTDPAALSLFGVVPTAAGIHVSAASAMRVPAVSAAVGLISEAVGCMPVKIYDRADKAQVGSHPAHRLIHRQANPWTSATELRTAMTADCLLRGQAWKPYRSAGAMGDCLPTLSCRDMFHRHKPVSGVGSSRITCPAGREAGSAMPGEGPKGDRPPRLC